MNKQLTKKQLQVMRVLWNSYAALMSSDISNIDKTLNPKTVQLCLKQLLERGYIRVEDIAYSGTVLSRRYVPTITVEEYLKNTYGYLIEGSDKSLLVALINSKTTVAELDELQELIQIKRKQLMEK